ncbi:hypothetical protein N0V90_008979 [Kalmusia sp. IMI 367209]|nr:hypothetical protein N0V90_008979 [Kalmusia sp. IMI 367209]
MSLASQPRASASRRRASRAWSVEIFHLSPTMSVNPKEYLTALSDLLSFTSDRMRQVNLPDLIWAFNDAHLQSNRVVMRQLAFIMIPILEQVQKTYHDFCDTRGTYTEEEIWKMVLVLGDDGSDFWDVVDELGELIEIIEGEETEGFWMSLEDIMTRE